MRFRQGLSSHLVQLSGIYKSSVCGNVGLILTKRGLASSSATITTKNMVRHCNAFRYMSSLNVHNKAVEGKDAASIDATTDEMKDLSTKDKVKLMWQRYGMVFVGTYLITYTSTLGGLFFALDNDLLLASSLGLDTAQSVQRVCDLVEKIPHLTFVSEYIRGNPRAGTFAIAYVFTKFTEPLRAVFSLGMTPSVARALGRAPHKVTKDKKGTSNLFGD